MSQIASFYLIKNNQRQELSDGDCSGAVYMAIWDWCESELDLDVRFPAPQTEDTLDCALLEGELASQLLAALREQDLPELAAEIAPDWDLPTEAVQSGLNTLRSKIHRENCHELAAYLVSCSRSRAYDMLRKQREEPLEEIPNEPDSAPVPDDAAVSTDNIEHLTELIGQMKPMYRDPLRLLAMGYTNREIAESLGLTDEVVRMRLFRGRKLLWKELNSHE